ncbi:tyrosine-type recombinase/integrase [Brevibacterium luteolum]|uniref:tyrosine-type recombinase/integrase n=1 Tax=Brevibacterium luteolum TaxID=199591 RepID=UPI00223BBBA0|nr:site-specific integrase [Brevibacterium luteolum]MCT1658213.1 site-specific integrase [Brevibacterium luteolum]MCT1920927.1 site-specific integrase [Brevibacterium luteolum]
METTAKKYPITRDGIVDYGKHAPGFRWGIDIRIGDRRARERFPTKAKAIEERDRIRSIKLYGTEHTAGSASKMTLAAVWDKWTQAAEFRNQTDKRQYELTEHWNNLLQRNWKHVTLDKITYGRIAEWASGLRDMSHSRQVKAIQLLTRLLNYAVDLGIIVRNPAYKPSGKRDYMPKPKPAESDDKPALTPRQLHRLALAAEEWSDLVLFIGTTGLRWGEAVALEVADINLRTHRVHVSKAVTNDRGKTYRGRRGMLLTTPKTHEKRTVPVPQTVIDRLGDRLNGAPQDLIFSERDKPLVHTTFNRRFKEWSDATATAVSDLQRQLNLKPTGYTDQETLDAAREAGVTDHGLILGDEDFQSIRAHGLRHTAISALINAGVPVTTVSKFAGHQSPTVTLNVYSHLYSSSLDQAGEVMNDLIESAQTDGQLEDS